MKLSPITIPYRAFQRASSVLLLAVFASSAGGASVVGGPIVVAALTALALLGLIAYEIAYYRRFEYELTTDTFDIRSGVIGRREREIPYDRIQNVDVTRSVVQRVLGIAAVGLETAGGERTEGSIRYVSPEAAEHLQREIRRRKRAAEAGHDVERGDETELYEAPEEELYAISPGELGLVGALSFDARVVGVLTLLGPGSVPILSGVLDDPATLLLSMGVLFAGVLLLAAWLLGIAVAVVNYYGFRLTRAEDELRYERGLFRRYEGSIPLEKVQTVTIRDNPLKRAAGYASATVETAGYSPGGDGGGSQVAIPIARRERVRELVEEVEPVGDYTLERPPGRIRRRYLVRYSLVVAGLVSLAAGIDYVLATDVPWYWAGALVVLVPPAAHLTWVHRGYAVRPDHVVTRNGFWRRSVTVIPYYRVQTVIDSRSIFQRRWDVATVIVDTAGSGSLVGGAAAAVDVDVADAVALGETLNERLQVALSARRRDGRSSATPE